MRIIGQPPRREPVSTGKALFLAAAIVAACGVAIEYVAPSSNEGDRLYVIEATTDSGDVYDAGSGGDCASAWRNIEMPAGWVRMVCVKAY